MLNSPWIRSLLSSIAAFVIYGGWAYFVNRSHDESLAQMIGVVQGGYSFGLTFVMTLVTEWLYQKFSNQTHQVRYVMVTVCTALFIMPVTIHWMIGTPEILMTILPGFVIGSIYTWVYVLGLSKVVLETTAEPS